jgi:hypothetical protein
MPGLREKIEDLMRERGLSPEQASIYLEGVIDCLAALEIYPKTLADLKKLRDRIESEVEADISSIYQELQKDQKID